MSKTKNLIGVTVNRVSATNCIGVFKNKMIGIEIGESWKDTNVYVNGEKSKKHFTGIWIKMLPNKKTKLTLEMKP